jgi:hypothetical protein
MSQVYFSTMKMDFSEQIEFTLSIDTHRQCRGVAIAGLQHAACSLLWGEASRSRRVLVTREGVRPGFGQTVRRVTRRQRLHLTLYTWRSVMARPLLR